MKHNLSDAAFKLMYQHITSERAIHKCNEKSLRQFLEAVYWMSRTGAQWRFLPSEYGNWNSVYKRFTRWTALGIWRRMFHHFSQDIDTEWLMIDSTIVRAHACAAGAKGGRIGRLSGAVPADLPVKFMSQ